MILVVVGVKFMGEIVKILSFEKIVLMFILEVICFFDFGCFVDEFSVFCDEYFDCEVVVYVNILAAVKVRLDWVVILSIVLELVEYLYNQGKKIFWVSDKYLGVYVQCEMGVDVLFWDSVCIVYDEFKVKGFQDLKKVYLDVVVFVYLELLELVVNLVDVVGFIFQLIQVVQKMENSMFIVVMD